MKTPNTPRILIPLLSLTLLTLPGLRAQDQGTNNTTTNSTQGNDSCGKGCGQGWHHHHEGENFANLTSAERQELRADMQKIKDDPQLQTAREAVKQAEQSLKQVREQLLLQVDPSVQPILDKLNQGKNQGTNAPTAPGGN